MHQQDVIDRALSDWRRHLAEYSLSSLARHVHGHFYGMVAHGGFFDCEYEYWEWLESQVEMTSEHRSRLNPLNWLNVEALAQLRTRSDEEAIREYVRIWRDIERECAVVVPPAAAADSTTSEPYSPPDGWPRTLSELLPAILLRPGLYLGNSALLTDLLSFLHGFILGASDSGVALLEAEHLVRFQEWVDERYPFGRGQTWAKTLQVLSLGSYKMAFASFEEHWALFHENRPPSVADPGMVEMLTAIRRLADQSKRPTKTPDEV